MRSFSRMQQRIVYTIPWEGAFTYTPGFIEAPVSLVTSDADTSFLRDSIVVIGASFRAGRDLYATPLGESPGSLILLNAIHSLLQYGELRLLPVKIKLLIEIVFIVGMSVAFMRWYSFRGMLAISACVYLLLLPIMLWMYWQRFWVEVDLVIPLVVVQLRQMAAEFRMTSEFNALKEQIKN